jgi:hypothetical protein
MALTANAIPSQIASYATPYDAANAFASAQIITATGYLNNLNSGQLDLGGATPSSGAGRTQGMWCIDITNLNFGTGDEVYQFMLLASNDVAFGNGNVELLAFHDLSAASSGRLVPTLMGVTPTIPPVGLAGTLFQIPYTNLMQRIYYRYIRCRMAIGGTGPTATVTTWLSNSGEKF